MPKAKLNPPEAVNEIVSTTDVPYVRKPYGGRISSWRRKFVAPGRYCIIGKVYGSTDWANGSIITTSMVVKRNGQEIETLNSRYRLVGK